ncbi:MAG: DUF742 domain-containing protein [Acidimicrobiia bacterium]|nr:DUF742 domain-containing protein [Acidimicrobiia bacterium]
MSRIPPYLVSGGRTRPSRDVAIETLVETPSEVMTTSKARFETRAILELAANPISVAELAVGTGLPLGTTLVLVSDLLDTKELLGHETTEQSELSNREIMTRIIHRVREL